MKKNEHIIKLAALVILICLGVLIEVVQPGFYTQLWQLTTSKDALVNYLQSFGIWAMLVSFLLDVLINAVGFLPSIFISTANGLVFGLPCGIIISWLAETVGVIISFLLMRFFFRDMALALIEKSNALQHLDDASGENGFWWMLFARALPYVPSGLLTAVGAISKIGLKDYMVANLIGKFPATALEVVIGHDLMNLQEHYKRLTLWICLAIIIFVGIKYWNKKKNNKGEK